MRHFLSTLICLFIGVLALAQQPIDFVQFIKGFDWSLNRDQIKAKYAGNAYSNADSVIVNNLIVDGTSFKVSIGLETNNYTPVGFMAKIVGGSFDNIRAILIDQLGTPEESENPDGPNGVFWMGDPLFLALTPQVYGCGIAAMQTKVLTDLFTSILDDTPKEHLKFKGVPIDGTQADFVNEMRKKGFTKLNEIDGVVVMNGPFAGYNNARLYIYQSNDVVYNVSAFIDLTESWKESKVTYLNMKASLTKKYGIEPKVSEYFPNYPNEGSGIEYIAFDRKDAEYESVFWLDNGYISLSIIHMPTDADFQLLLSYLDKQNSRKQMKDVEDDL